MIIGCIPRKELSDLEEKVIDEYMTNVYSNVVKISMDGMDGSKIKSTIGKMIMLNRIFEHGEGSILSLADKNKLIERLHQSFADYVKARLEKDEAERLIESTNLNINYGITSMKLNGTNRYWVQELDMVFR